jgi:hypothetical protein
MKPTQPRTSPPALAPAARGSRPSAIGYLPWSRLAALLALPPGSGSFIPLTPRQALAPAPCAHYAPSAGTSTVANTVSSGPITSVMLAGGAVTSGKLGPVAVKLSSIDDRGSAAYDQFLRPAQAMGTTDPQCMACSRVWRIAPANSSAWAAAFGAS